MLGPEESSQRLTLGATHQRVLVATEAVPCGRPRQASERGSRMHVYRSRAAEDLTSSRLRFSHRSVSWPCCQTAMLNTPPGARDLAVHLHGAVQGAHSICHPPRAER